MLSVKQKYDGRMKISTYDLDGTFSFRVCAQPDKIAPTLPRDVLVEIRELVDGMNRILSSGGVNP